MGTELATGHDPNNYFQGFADIVEALDALTKAVSPDAGDDGTPADEGEPPCCNSYFTSFANVKAALGKLKDATEERIEALTEKDPAFTAWKDGAYSINVGSNSKVTSNGIAIGASAVAASGTGSYAKDSGAVAIGRITSAYGHRAVALGKDAQAGSDGNRTTESTVQLGAGVNDAKARSSSARGRWWMPRARCRGSACLRTPGGLVEATGAYGVSADRTNALWYAVFTLEGLGLASTPAVLKSVSFLTHSQTPLATGVKRRLVLCNNDRSLSIATSDAREMAEAGAKVTFTFDAQAELQPGVRYVLLVTDESGAEASAPVMLASTAGAGGYLACKITGRTYDATDLFPTIGYTTLAPAPDIATVLAEAKEAVEATGGLELASPAASGGTVALANHAVNSVTLSGAAAAFTFPDAVEGHGRSFILRLTMGAATTWTLPGGVAFESDDSGVFDEVAAGGGGPPCSSSRRRRREGSWYRARTSPWSPRRTA